MRKVQQAEGNRGECRRACLASVLELELDSVPRFSSDLTDAELFDTEREFLITQGYYPITVGYMVDEISELLDIAKNVNPNVYYMLVGASTDGYNHSVVCLNDKILHNPSDENQIIAPDKNTGGYWMTFFGHADMLRPSEHALRKDGLQSKYYASKVKDFAEACGGMSIDLRLKFIGEHGVKFITSMVFDELDELAAATTVSDQIDAMADIMYYLYHFSVSNGINLDPFLDIVHKANMTKIGPNGKVIFRDDGKILKPEGFVDPQKTNEWRSVLGQQMKYGPFGERPKHKKQ